MKRIPLTQNQYALVDDGDYEWLRVYRWYAKRCPYTFYAARDIRIDKKQCRLPMHRLILGLVYRDGKQTDHIDGNGLNNQRSNLRICTKSENAQNKRPARGFTSQYKGVFWRKDRKKWRAHIKLNGRLKVLGSFSSEIEAALAYNRAAKELFGEYAQLNDVTPRGLNGPSAAQTSRSWGVSLFWRTR